jgi:vacuolar protein sorting-associated protein 35
VQQLIIFIQPVLVKESDYEDISELLFKEEQTIVGKIVWQIKSEDPQMAWTILKAFIDKFLEGGDERMRFTLPPSIFRLLELANSINKQEPEIKVFKKIFELTRKLIQTVCSILPVLGLKLYLEYILTINRIDTSKFYDEFTYETASECLLHYEQQISDSAIKQTTLGLIINTFMRLNCVSSENYDTLLSNITSYCSKILKKNEQCEVLLSCCYLFTNPQVPLPALRPTTAASTRS